MRETAPGAVHVPGWLTLDEQRHLVQACREWAMGPVPIRHTGGPSRFAYHGVPKVYPGTGDPATGPASGRLDITMRVTGLR
ncbi:hypothetical protein [Nonomuraea sp. NPDC050786]|uniref:hypothetical protein n=1 Tax=Nonomuraea sp. NPDC050786 TaxID=3154840 RepID=UPI00340EE14C